MVKYKTNNNIHKMTYGHHSLAFKSNMHSKLKHDLNEFKKIEKLKFHSIDSFSDDFFELVFLKSILYSQ